jgi:hypothetical protein
MVQRHDVEHLRQINPVAWDVFTNDFTGVSFVLWVHPDGSMVIEDESTSDQFRWDGADWVLT